MIDEKKLIERIKEEPTDGMYTHEIIEAIEEQPKVNQWIPCKERLPKEKGWYLVFAKGQRPFVAYFKGKTFPLNNHYHEIVAWMPLPDDYVSEDES